MKTTSSLVVVLSALALVAAVPALGQGGDDDYGLPPEPEDQWRISLGPSFRAFSEAHDALQVRADDSFEHSEEWRNGKVDGDGWGLRMLVGRGDGEFQINFYNTEYEFEVIDLETPAGQRIKTERRDVDIVWSQITGAEGNTMWGWKAGYRHVGTEKTVRVVELDAEQMANDNVNWNLLTAGYWGDARPFGGKIFKLHGAMNLFLGEVAGMAREGSDEDPTDGTIGEVYQKSSFSVAYGLNFDAGLRIKLYRELELALDYRREWLYSFESTASGIVVFPDNADALFIENTQLFSTYLMYKF
jgi:hypothetical protein